MMLNSKSRWGSISQVLHWVTAVLIFFSIITGLMWWLRQYTQVGVKVISNHKTVGLLILLIVIVRVIWRQMTALPTPHHSLTITFQKVIKMSHQLIIALMLVMPISGWMMSTAAGYKTNVYVAKISMPFIKKSDHLVMLTSIVHRYAGWLLLLFIVIHIFIAFWHHFSHKDPTLLRMTPRLVPLRLRIKKQ